MRTTIMVTLALSAVILAILGVAAFLRAKAKGRYFSFSLLCASGALYAALYSVELSSPDLASLLLVIRFEYLGLSALPVFLFLVVRNFSGVERPRPGVVALVSVIPVVTMLLVATVDRHSLYYVDPTVSYVDGLSIISFGRGVWYWVNLCYLYCFVLYGIVVFTRAARHGNANRRIQAGYMLAGTLMPWLGNFIYVMDLSPYGVDPGPFFLMLTGAFFSLGFFRYRLFDIHPLARDMVFGQMRDAALVVDEDGFVVDHNEEAAALFPGLVEQPRGLRFADLVAGNPGLEAVVAREATALPVVFPLPSTGDRRYESRHASLRSRGGALLGEVYTIIDVTDREELRLRLEELASTDELTKLPNRRRFYELAGIELDRARRHGRPIGFAVMDMDGFKAINDKYGHKAGDEALRVAARLCLDALRSCDVIGRIGGDEFAFVFPECDEAGAAVVADKLRAVVRAGTFSTRERLVPLSASIGSVGAAGPPYGELEEYLSEADLRMYATKGRPAAEKPKAAPGRPERPSGRSG